MSSRFNSNALQQGNVIKFSGWLTLKPGCTPKFTAKQPKLAAGERSMHLLVSVPKAVFETPQMAARITIPESYAPEFEIDVQAAEDALAGVVGFDVRVDVQTGE